MSDRSTCATDAQIEAAENRCEEGGQFNAVWIRDLAEYLVPPDKRIVPVSPLGEQLYRKCPDCTGKRVSMYAGLRVVSYENADGMIVTKSCDCGTGFVPVSPVRADREAVVEANEILDWVIEVASWENADAHDALLRLRSALDSLRATPEPERAGETE